MKVNVEDIVSFEDEKIKDKLIAKVTHVNGKKFKAIILESGLHYEKAYPINKLCDFSTEHNWVVIKEGINVFNELMDKLDILELKL